MSTSALRSERKVPSVSESFAFGVVMMLGMNVLQRLIGLGRNFGFCQFLSDSDLGHWALANSFFVIAAPLAVLGLPGSFGKYVEHFRVTGGLGDYVRKVLLFSFAGMTLFSLAMLIFPDTFSFNIYGEAGLYRAVAWTVITFLTMTSFNIVYELVVAMRLVRVATFMQFAQSAGFALIGLSWLYFTSDWLILLPSYALACLLAAIPGVYAVFAVHGNELRMSTSSPNPIWSRILPFAAMLWLTNLLTNSFELVDRYMLLHFCEGGEQVGQRLVGQFYCGRIVPNLLISLALMVSGMLLPYLSADWERRNNEAILRRIKQVLSIVSVTFLALSVAALLCEPLLFHWLLKGRYEEAQSILGIALAQCTWSSLTVICSAYLLCAEKGKLSSLILGAGLVVNLGLNFPLIQHFGLYGAMLATWVANGFVFSATYWTVSRQGCRIGWPTYILCLAPSLLLLGAVPSALGLAVLFVLAGRTDWLLSAEDRREIDRALLPKLARFGLRLRTLWP